MNRDREFLVKQRISDLERVLKQNSYSRKLIVEEIEKYKEMFKLKVG